MILFEDLEVRNFMNYGNVPTKLSLNSHRNTIITGKNGSGKSTILLDSICYCLYNKPYRDIKLGQLVNSINGKNASVVVRFRKFDDVYVVTRGQKPAIFTIEKNGIPVDEESIRGSYQEYLEGIIGMNFMTFKQVVVIGSANYVPFMRLTTPQRREVVEMMLPIKVFTEAARLTRERIANVKKEISDIDIRISTTKESLRKSKEILESIQDEKKRRSVDLGFKKKQIEDQLSAIKNEWDSILVTDDKIDKIEDKISKLNTGHQQASNSMYRLESEISSRIKTKNFYQQDQCPTCHQNIDPELRDGMIHECDRSLEEFKKKQEELQSVIDGFILKQEKLQENLEQLQSDQRKIRDFESKTRSLNLQLRTMDEFNDDPSTEIKVKENISTSLDEVDQLIQMKGTLINRQSVLNSIQEMCKDSGVKAIIVQEFIPMMNQKINHFLNLFDLFVNFELDSEFNETIKSRGRDSFSYNSFSEGEKQRIDLAILFAWREISIQKNAATTNLLIFDETLDKSLDADAVDVFMNILESIGKNIHVFVVSHKDVVPEVFDRSIRVEKKNDFGVLTIT